MDKQYTYIVTGCTGYVGNAITKKLLDAGCDVIGLARSEEKVNKVFKDKSPKIVYGDIRNVDDLEKLFVGDKPFVIFHTVAYVTIGEGDKKELFDVTVGGTKNMINVSLKHNIHNFLHISSSEALPEKFKLNKDLSNYIPNPKKARKGYSRAKSMADVAILDAYNKNHLPACLLLLAGVLGPGDYSLTHMSQMMIDYVKGNLPASINGGYNDFDIRDFTDVLFQIIDKARSGESYIFANRPDKINEVLEYVGNMFNKKPLLTLPLWTAYLGLPFLWLGSKITRKRPLYTLSSLASLKADTDFPLDKVINEFGYHPRPLEETVEDHMKFLVDEGFLKQ